MTQAVLDKIIITSLKPMFKRATAEGLWFFHQDDEGNEVWCSPGYLKKEQKQGRLILAPEHWELRNPVGYMTKLVNDAQNIVTEYNDMARRLKIEETLELIAHSSNPADAR